MNTVDVIQGWVTLLGAVIAAVASAWSLWRSLRKDGDQIKVGFGPLEPPTEPGYWLHVVSRSDHHLMLANYGFIGSSGELLSLPQLSVDEPDEERRWVRGEPLFDKRGEVFEVGTIKLRDKQIGAFAITVGQERYTLAFDHSVPSHTRIWIRLRTWWKPRWQ